MQTPFSTPLRTMQQSAMPVLQTAGLPQGFEDMPLTDALYIGSRGKIYGCRGGYLFEFDGAGVYTGRSCAFAESFIGDSYLDLRPTDGKLFASHWSDWNTGERQGARGFYRFNLDSMRWDEFFPFNPPVLTSVTTFVPGLGYTFSADILGGVVNGSVWFPSRGSISGMNFGAGNIGLSYDTGQPLYSPSQDVTTSNTSGYGGATCTFGPYPVDVDVKYSSITANPNTGQAIANINGGGNTDLVPIGSGNNIVTITSGNTGVIALHGGGVNDYFSIRFELTPAYANTTRYDTSSGRDGEFQNGPRRFAFASDGTLFTNGIRPKFEGGILGVYHADIGIFSMTSWLEGVEEDNAAVGWNVFWYDDVDGKVWIGSDAGLIRCTPSGAGFSTVYFDIYAFVTTTIGGINYSFPAGGVYGIDLWPAGDTLYTVTRSQNVYTIARTATHMGGHPDGAFSTFSLGRSTATPRNIRWVPYKSRFYIPTMQDNCVLELDPTTNTVTNTFTGFDCPWDIVDTGSRVFAIQLGKVGLKQVV